MKGFFKVLLWIFIGILVVAGGFLLWVNYALPEAGAVPEITVEKTDERLRRGEYLATHVMVCTSCHSPRDWTQFAAPLIKEKIGSGGAPFTPEKGAPGTFYPGNLTPYHLSDWTDGELFHAITAGIHKEGRPLFPIMPYHEYGKLDKEDIYSIIAYLRTLPAVESEKKEPQPDFPLNIIMNFMPEEPQFTEIPDEKDTIAYGEYLTNAAACSHCHTPRDNGRYIDSLRFAGGMEFPVKSGGVAISANITPDKKTGIGSWTEETFVQRFKYYLDSDYHGDTIKQGQMNTEMPWREYAGMKEKDLKAIYAYLQSLDPIENRVVIFRPE